MCPTALLHIELLLRRTACTFSNSYHHIVPFLIYYCVAIFLTTEITKFLKVITEKICRSVVFPLCTHSTFSFVYFVVNLLLNNVLNDSAIDLPPLTE